MKIYEKTGEEVKIFFGNYSMFNRKNSTTVSNNTNAAESLGDFRKSLGEKRLTVSKNWLKVF